MSFEKVKKNFGFGCMRLPMKGNEVDLGQFSQMVDIFMAEGLGYISADRAKRRSASVSQRDIRGRVSF